MSPVQCSSGTRPLRQYTKSNPRGTYAWTDFGQIASSQKAGSVNHKTDEKTGDMLVLFTSKFPFGMGEEFLEAEILHLSRFFNRIMLVPQQTSEVRRPLPANVAVDRGLADRRSGRFGRFLSATWCCLSSQEFYRELRRRPRTTFQLAALKALVRSLHQAHHVRGWLNASRSSKALAPRVVFYTYWCGPATYRLGADRRSADEYTVISRAHRYDLYEEQTKHAYIPLRPETIRHVDRIFLVSAHAQHYLETRYPSASEKFCVSRLGVEDPGTLTPPSFDGTLRVVSCSFLTQVKRIHLIIDSLASLAARQPSLRIEWNHLGDGPLRQQLEGRASRLLPPQVSWQFHGYLANDLVFEFYRTHHIDVFINCSESEGLPVSIMEAQSCGIPVVATAVGGTPEVVNSENGVLLRPQITPEEVARALEDCVDVPLMRQKRLSSRAMWDAKCNASVNYALFAQALTRFTAG